MALHIQQVHELLRQYDMKVTHLEEIGPNRFQIVGPFAVFEGRVVPLGSGLLRAFVTDAAHRKGFRRTQRFIINIYHEKMIHVGDEQIFYVTDALVGQSFQPTNQDVASAAKSLAGLHTSLDGLSQDMKKLMPGLVVAQYGYCLVRQQKVIAAIQAEQMMIARRADVHHPWSTWLHTWRRQAERVLHWFETLRVNELIRHSEERGDVAWNGLSLDSFVHLANQHVGIKQLVDPVFDTGLSDLATLAEQLCRLGSVESILALIDEYHANRPLSKQAMLFIRAYAAFPHLAYDLLRASHLRQTVANPSDENTVAEHIEIQQQAAEKLLKSLEQGT